MRDLAALASRPRWFSGVASGKGEKGNGEKGKAGKGRRGAFSHFFLQFNLLPLVNDSLIKDLQQLLLLLLLLCC